MSKRIAILEIGGSHDECILSQLIALKNEGAWIAFCSTSEMVERNSHFKHYVDEFHELVLPRSAWGDFMVMVHLNRWFKQAKIDCVIANTAQGGHVRNLCLTASKKITFFGVVHTIKLLRNSFTQRLISRKIKTYFVLNDTLKRYLGPQKGLTIHSFYPLNYPHFTKEIAKSSTEFWITIIGGVESRRKDLNGFLEMAKQMPAECRFVFLGKSNLKLPEVSAFIQQLSLHGLLNRVTIFESFVSEVDFDAYLKQTDAILPLVHPDTPSADEYFTHQISGAINVSFAYKIPMMIHEKYSDWEDFSKGVVFYNLHNFNSQFTLFKTKHSALKKALENVEKLNAENQNKRFAHTILTT